VATVTNIREQQRCTRERAIEVHDGAATFWEARGNLTRAARERAIASAYREIAELERLLRVPDLGVRAGGGF
jgi:hypothetical protein